MSTIIATAKVTSRHWQLYLSADPDQKVINSYLPRSIKFEIDDPTAHPIATLMLLPTRPGNLEIINLAVALSHRHHGLGKQLVNFAAQYAGEFHYQLLTVGTASTSFGPLAFYQHCGFRVTGVDRDFFTIHYSTPLTENGLPVCDMIRLALPIN